MSNPFRGGEMGGGLHGDQTPKNVATLQRLLHPHPGTDVTETHGAQVAGASYTSNEQKMLQVCFNALRAAGLLA